MPASKPTTDDDGWTPVDDAPAVHDTVEVVDIAVAENVAHPTRGRLLRRLRQPQSVAELAEWLDVPVTRLYHHVKLLESDGLIHVAATRQVGAATERRYQATARSYRLPKAVIANTEPAQLGQLLGSVFDLAKLDLIDFVERGGLAIPDIDHQMVLGLSHIRLTPTRRTELVAALVDVLREFENDPDSDDAEPFATFVAAFAPNDD